MNSVVLARYNESLDWILDIPDDFDIVIYNKGEPIDHPDVIRRAAEIIDRPNVGRESETYLHHMMTKVGDDQGFTVYSQGDPHTHSPDFIKLLQNWRDWKKVQPLSWCWIEEQNIPPATLLADYQSQLGGRLRVRPERFSLSAWGATEFVDAGANGMGMVYRILHGLPDGGNIAAHFLRKCKLDELADKADRHSLGVFSYGAIFAARNDTVAAVPKESLKLASDFSTAGVVAHGYILERMWLHLFGTEFVLAKNMPARL
ncbi:hypothetical protein [Rhizobium sp. HT1-10]|uniref:hypothetical protein n=1 Tax=Rhizobium sp. HT1-10 TaxID=3111638 RepID=UPI003C18A6B8